MTALVFFPFGEVNIFVLYYRERKIVFLVLWEIGNQGGSNLEDFF